MGTPWPGCHRTGEELAARAIEARGVVGRAGARAEHKRFDDEAATWDDDPAHERRQVAVAEAVKEAVHLEPRMKAVGGGTGRLSIPLADQVGSVVVTDPSAGMVEVARERIEAARAR